MSGEGFQFLLLRDDNRSLRERLKAAEKVIEAARLVSDGECLDDGETCDYCALARALNAYDEQTAR